MRLSGARAGAGQIPAEHLVKTHTHTQTHTDTRTHTHTNTHTHTHTLNDPKTPSIYPPSSDIKKEAVMTKYY